ncbi:tail fiber protein [Flavobacterium sp. LS1R49]|uniref:Tail fiber protein n=1 Tax=Flavobacterium shii TaxID=2987687 RepID=A0A9X2ZGS8_9FLAO|nr:tail fiber protein [Flavobacterium shii]MCV9930425.1 tail fiber protein [Flavobacterium shii]
MDEYIGIVKIFAGNFAPAGWAFCDGSLLSIAQNQALFAIIGTTYGGNGQNTFGLPDLRSRVPLGATNASGPGPGLSTYPLGQPVGTEKNTLLITNLPPHSHTGTMSVSKSNGSLEIPVDGSSLAASGTPSGRGFAPTMTYNSVTPDTKLNATSVVLSSTGGGIPVNNIQPVLAINYIICLQGLFPSRN